MYLFEWKKKGNKNIVHIKIHYHGVKYMCEENHQSKLDRCINPDEPALHWIQKFKRKKGLGLA